MEEVINIISTLGFPIFTTVALFYFVVKYLDKQIEDNNKREAQIISACNAREERFSEQIDRLADTLNNFNITLTKIDGRLEALEKIINQGE